MKQLLQIWRRLLKENAYAMGTFGVNVHSGKPSSPCPQGEFQNGFHPDGTPYCKTKPKLGDQETIEVKTLDKIKNIIKRNPNQEIVLDNPKGTVKKFGGRVAITLPFHYGYWPQFINPADNAGWDLIIVPSAKKKKDEKWQNHNLIPIGFVAYNENKPNSMWNDKIIVAPAGNYNSNDREIIKSVFDQMDYFDEPVWY
tara:strand:- start:653 stop:1246 length:594 start_codon:yes stop_codon:yes gene_type:complete